MKQNRKLFLLLLILTICICNAQHKTAKAAQDSVLSLSNTTSDTPLAANTPVNTEFTITNTNIETLTFMIYTTDKTDMLLQITGSNGQTACNASFKYTDSNWQTATINEKIKYSRTVTIMQPKPDKYTFNLTFSNDTYYIVNGMQNYTAASKKVPALSTTSLILAKGMSQKISVNNNSEKVTWSSTNKSVATVSSNGKIKTKKVGSSIIKAKIAGSDSDPLTCRVTVVKNEYLGEKKTLLDVPVDQAMVNVFKVSYDKKGNIIMKARVLNRYDYRITYMKNLKIQLKTNSGKVIGTYTAKKTKAANAKAGRYKTCILKIKKSKLKIKMTDLRTIKAPKTSGGIPILTSKPA